MNPRLLFAQLTPVVKNLIIINFLLWLATIILVNQGVDLNGILGLHHFKSDSFEPYQLVTYWFMHSDAGISHVLFNMLGLFFFGPRLESLWGSKRFLIYYSAVAIGAGIFIQVIQTFEILYYVGELATLAEVNSSGIVGQLTEQGQVTLAGIYYGGTVGASGAIFGILFAYAWFWPNQIVHLYFMIPVKIKWLVIGYGAIELIQQINYNPGDQVSHAGHLGGLLIGFLLIRYFKRF